MPLFRHAIIDAASISRAITTPPDTGCSLFSTHYAAFRSISMPPRLIDASYFLPSRQS
jgi:hypothetical protein